MPSLALTNFNIVVGLLGGWISLFGLVSFLCKETYYLSEALISLLAGVAFSPSAANLIRPLDYAGTPANVEAVTLAFSRLVLGVQLVLAGVQLPSRYLRTQWKPMALLVGPVMTCMWLATSLLVWALTPRLPFLHALAIGACVTPTDPVLSNVIVKGRFADHNIPRELQNLIISESGANDGLGYPFLFFALYLIKYVGDGGHQVSGGAGLAMGLWFGETWGYTIILSVIYGAVVGWLAKTLLWWAESHKYVDRESFLVFAIALALFIVGTCGMIGSDDVLACFIAGNAFTWDDWFRSETEDDSFQPTIDMLLNVTIFIWYGAVIPWNEFAHNDVIPIYRLIALGILVLLLRRLPFVFAIHRWIPQIEQAKQAIFVGFFGPIGVSAIFYLYVTVEFLDALNEGDEARADVAHMADAVRVIVWFLAVCSIVVHGLSIPLGKLGYYAPRTLSRGVSFMSGAGEDNTQPFRIRGRVVFPFGRSRSLGLEGQRAYDAESRAQSPSGNERSRPIYRIGGSIIPQNTADAEGPGASAPELGRPGQPEQRLGPEDGDGTQTKAAGQHEAPVPPELPNRTIRFPDETRTPR
ncbi:sodium/hydrogen exchanger family protein [Colletotrichum navitas]|uniref:Sodium/hydrogen exchanger family protein n=1 Tax=Colletotrichum navitas TaxID=681940 RepID=A0AAD8QB00_9PEZI|nr:sodium/hydrogen exchanger family protein [Colletotrichum navitas]KAK1597674.1 sodium/hydrogen exchanger family protein [Colletotrichum navitas]